MGLNKSSIRVLALTAAVCWMAGCASSEGDKDIIPSTLCKDGALRCVDNNVMKCQSNDWIIETACNASQSCDPVNFKCDEDVVLVCRNGEVKCEGKVPKYCDQNSWQSREACGENEQCDNTTGQCLEPTCTAGVTCDGDKLVVCSSSGQITETNCADQGKHCDENAQDCVEVITDLSCTVDGQKLENGASICDSTNNLSTCENGSVNSDECEDGEVCRNGESACSRLKACGSLHSGEMGCSDGNVVKCVDGTLNTSEACTGGKVCTPVAGGFMCKQPPSDSCKIGGMSVENGAYGCDGNVLKKCESGTASAGKDCAENHDGNSLCKVNTCVPKPCTDKGLESGGKACNDGGTNIIICTDGVISEATGSEACTASQYCKNAECFDKPVGKKYTTIKSIHEDYDVIMPSSCLNNGNKNLTETPVEVTGVVTALKTNGFYMQDPAIKDGKYAGIMVACSTSMANCTFTGFGSDEIAVGDNVKVVSDFVGYSDCQLQIRTYTGKTQVAVTKTSDNNIVNPVTVNIKDINHDQHNDYNGSLVTLNYVTVLDYSTTQSVWNIVDEHGDKTAASNYIKTISSALLSNRQYNLTGIVYFNKNTKASNIAPSIIPCPNTPTKCDDNKLYVCKDGVWDKGKACTTTVAHADPVCNDDHVTCSYKCKGEEGFVDHGGVCEKPEPDKKSCTDVNKKEVLHDASGCKTAEIRATCNDGNWENDKPCPTDPNGITSCSDDKCALTCNKNYKLSSDGKSCVKTVFESCKDYYDQTVEHGKKGCITTVAYATCNDGIMDKDKADCTTKVQNAVPICKKDGSCGFECVSGYELSSDGKGCVAAAPTYKSCKNAAGRDVVHMGESCVNENEYGRCNDGKWDNVKTCPYGCDIYRGVCAPAPITWCWFKHVESDGSAAYVRFAQPEDTVVNAQFVCNHKSDTNAVISTWSFFVDAFDATDGCDSSCGVNKEYKTTSLPSESGMEYKCVALVKVEGGKSYVCPNFDMGGDVSKLVEYGMSTTATDSQMRTYTGSGSSTTPISGDKVELVKWDFNDSNVTPDSGILKTSATFGLSASSTSLKYKSHSSASDMAVYASGWKSSITFSTSPYYSIKLNTTGYKNITISFESASSKADSNLSLSVAYKTDRSFIDTMIVLPYTDQNVYHSIKDKTLPEGANNKSSVEIGIFPKTSSTDIEVMLDNIVINGVKI